MSSMEENGSNGPRENANSGIDTLKNTTDYHVWLVDKYDNDKIIDYLEKQLIPLCQYRTNRIVRKPWPEHLSQKIWPRFNREGWVLIPGDARTY